MINKIIVLAILITISISSHASQSLSTINSDQTDNTTPKQYFITESKDQETVQVMTRDDLLKNNQLLFNCAEQDQDFAEMNKTKSVRFNSEENDDIDLSICKVRRFTKLPLTEVKQLAAYNALVAHGIDKPTSAEIYAYNTGLEYTDAILTSIKAFRNLYSALVVIDQNINCENN